MGEYALQSFAKICQSVPVQTDAFAADDAGKVHPIDLLVTAAEFAAVGAKEGACKPSILCSSVWPRQVKKIRVRVVWPNKVHQ